MPTNSEYTGYPDGYAAGQGGVVTQGSSRVTTVVLNKLTGQITTFAATLAADTDVSFTMTNSQIAANDIVLAQVIGGAAVKGGYAVNIIPGAGTSTVTLHNVTPSTSASESPVIQFIVFKGVIA